MSLGKRAAAIDALLPQTQCRRCGYDDCAAYAQALDVGEATADRCPPGGDTLAARLAALLGVAARPVDRSRGEVAPWRRAVIIEADCIGCTRCIAVCPVDAIVGAARLMHAVLADECTGCDLCLPACPVDCIEMRPAAGQSWTPAGTLERWFEASAARGRTRYAARRLRDGEATAIRAARRVAPSETPAVPAPDAALDTRSDFLAASLARARRRREAAS